MAIQPLKSWVCDTCGDPILSVDDGYVEFIRETEAPYRASQFHIVHQRSSSPIGACYQHEHARGRADLALRDFTGGRGQARLLSFLDVGPEFAPDFEGPGVLDLREFTDFARRLTIPYYEEARQHWKAAWRDGFFDGTDGVYGYFPDQLRLIAERYANEPLERPGLAFSGPRLVTPDEAAGTVPAGTLRFTVQSSPPSRGVYEMHPMLEGNVDVGGRTVPVELGLAGDETTPARFVVTFRTREAPVGCVFHVEVTDFLESLVRAYFAAHPTDEPARRIHPPR